jgi:RHS repeat-associated protein
MKRFFSLLFILLTSVSAAPSSQGAQQHADDGVRPLGRSSTVLPDLRIMAAGGRTATGATAEVILFDGSTGRPINTASLLTPRAFHSATVMSDGTVLIAGGLGPDARAAVVAELFDPTAAQSAPAPAWITPRAGHTATLLPDGRVLFLGGTDEAGPISSIEIWDPTSLETTVMDAEWAEARAGHEAELQADGTVLVRGGRRGDEAGGPPILFDPGNGTFSAAARVVSDQRALGRLGLTLPARGATQVAVDTRVALLFSEPVVNEGLDDRISLTGESGAIGIEIVRAEGGRLLLLGPQRTLESGSTYRVSISALHDSQGRPIDASAFTFTTATSPESLEGSHGAPMVHAGIGTSVAHAMSGDVSSWQQLPVLQAPDGVTAVAGQVLLLNGRPLERVTLSIGDRSAASDETGRFLLSDVSPGISGAATLLIDGRTASTPGRQFGVFEALIKVQSGKTTALDFSIWMPRIDTAHAVKVPYPIEADTIITTPFIPGLELHLPAGAAIRDHDGRRVEEISITPIPVDRPPFPLPSGVHVPVYFTVQPGGAYVRAYGSTGSGARLIYPNYRNAPPGTRADFWHYDPEDRGWHVYGKGTVDAGGRQVVPDPGVQIYEFTGAMLATAGRNPPPKGPTQGGASGGDPVDLSTGLFVMRKTDLVLPDVLPIALTRTYRNDDSETRPFGIGCTHPYDLWFANQVGFMETDLILPDGGRIHYTRTSSGTAIGNAVLEHTATPGRFYKSRLVYTGAGWDLILKDGTVYVFGVESPLHKIRDRFGNVITINRVIGSNGNITRITSPHGRYIEFTYDASDRVIEAEDNIGRRVQYSYDASGRLWKVTDAAEGVTEYGYDASHRMTSIKDPRGIVFLTNEYDSEGRVVRQIQADNGEYEFDYTVDGNGQVTQTDLTDPRGFVRRVTFDPATRYPVTDTEALGESQAQTISFTRVAGTSLVETITDELSRVTRLAYDTKGNVTSLTELHGTPQAVTTSFTYEPTFNLIASVTDPLNHTTTFGYDTLGRLLTITDPLSHATQLTWNSVGQVLSVRNALNQTTGFTYALADLVGITTPRGHTTVQTHDAVGRLVRVTDPLGATTQFEYNELNQVTKVIDAREGETAFTHDPNGNLLSLTDARSSVTTYTYDSMDRVETRTDPLLRQDTFEYDLMGNLTRWTDRKGQVTTYEYDALDREILVGFGTAGQPPNQTYQSTIATTWDDGDRPTQIVDSANATITRAYDLLDRMTSEGTAEGSVSYTYDAAGRRTGMTAGDQSAVSYAYDAADRLTSVTQGTAVVGFTYDAANRRATLTFPNGIVGEYGYDADSQLTGLTYRLGGAALGALTYSYDAAGRRSSVGGTWGRTSIPPALGSATYDAANQIVTWGGASFSYDANGNLTSDGTHTYTWNARDELTALSGGAPASFTYDAVGRRRSRTAGGVTTNYLYDALDVAQELVGGSASANYLLGLGIDERFVRTDGTGTYSYLTDALGSTLALADAAGTVPSEYTYEPFGATTQLGTGNANPARFTGREEDGTGLYYYRARYYDPRRQRFLSEDPMDFGGGDVNLHAYAGNSVINVSDPLGLCIPICAGAIVIANPAAAAAAATAVVGAGVIALKLGKALVPAVIEGIESISELIGDLRRQHSSDLGGDNPAYRDAAERARQIKEAQDKLKDRNTSARERSQAKKRLEDLLQRSSKKAHGADKKGGKQGKGKSKGKGKGGKGGKGGGGSQGQDGGTSGRKG